MLAKFAGVWMLPEEGGAGWSAGGVGWEKERPAGFMPTKWWWAIAGATQEDGGRKSRRAV